MKRVVLCADGTWNEPERVDNKTGRRLPTNVLKVARGVVPQATDGTSQVVYYHEGVGTRGGLDKWTGGAFGRGIERNVRSMYRFLVFNYSPGDEIYMFGFSRGAFTVRTLVGFMTKVGLVEKDDEYYTPELYALYEKNVAENSDRWKHAFRNVRGTRKCPPIRFMGVWDTVGALGAPGILGQLFNREKYKYHNVDLHPAIENAFQAVAIDERRKPFVPRFFTRPRGWTGELEQVWFAGVHCNVGGSYSPDGLANEALHWMVEKAEGKDLQFDDAFLAHYLPCFNSELHDSMSALYKVMGPTTRAMGQHRSDGESVHQSVLDRVKLPTCRYDPRNLRDYLAQGAPSVVNTRRVRRGTPCQ